MIGGVIVVVVAGSSWHGRSEWAGPGFWFSRSGLPGAVNVGVKCW